MLKSLPVVAASLLHSAHSRLLLTNEVIGKVVLWITFWQKNVPLAFTI